MVSQFLFRIEEKMTEFPPNSHRSKMIPAGPTEKSSQEKVVEKVVTNDVSRRKPPLGKRFAQTFFGGTAKNAAQYVVMEVLLPAAKDAIADAMSQGVERILFGETRSASRRAGGYRPPTAAYTAYNRMTSPPVAGHMRQEARTISREARSQHVFDEIIIATRIEAEHVLNKLEALVLEYGSCTVADFYSLVGATGEYTDDKYGWDSMRGANVVRVRDGYIVDLPRPVQL